MVGSLCRVSIWSSRPRRNAFVINENAAFLLVVPIAQGGVGSVLGFYCDHYFLI